MEISTIVIGGFLKLFEMVGCIGRKYRVAIVSFLPHMAVIGEMLGLIDGLQRETDDLGRRNLAKAKTLLVRASAMMMNLDKKWAFWGLRIIKHEVAPILERAYFLVLDEIVRLSKVSKVRFSEAAIKLLPSEDEVQKDLGHLMRCQLEPENIKFLGDRLLPYIRIFEKATRVTRTDRWTTICSLATGALEDIRDASIDPTYISGLTVVRTYKQDRPALKAWYHRTKSAYALSVAIHESLIVRKHYDARLIKSKGVCTFFFATLKEQVDNISKDLPGLVVPPLMTPADPTTIKEARQSLALLKRRSKELFINLYLHLVQMETETENAVIEYVSSPHISEEEKDLIAAIYRPPEAPSVPGKSCSSILSALARLRAWSEALQENRAAFETYLLDRLEDTDCQILEIKPDFFKTSSTAAVIGIPVSKLAKLTVSRFGSLYTLEESTKKIHNDQAHTINGKATRIGALYEARFKLTLQPPPPVVEGGTGQEAKQAYKTQWEFYQALLASMAVGISARAKECSMVLLDRGLGSLVPAYVFERDRFYGDPEGYLEVYLNRFAAIRSQGVLLGYRDHKVVEVSAKVPRCMQSLVPDPGQRISDYRFTATFVSDDIKEIDALCTCIEKDILSACIGIHLELADRLNVCKSLLGRECKIEPPSPDGLVLAGIEAHFAAWSGIAKALSSSWNEYIELSSKASQAQKIKHSIGLMVFEPDGIDNFVGLRTLFDAGFDLLSCISNAMKEPMERGTSNIRQKCQDFRDYATRAVIPGTSRRFSLMDILLKVKDKEADWAKALIDLGPLAERLSKTLQTSEYVSIESFRWFLRVCLIFRRGITAVDRIAMVLKGQRNLQLFDKVPASDPTLEVLAKEVQRTVQSLERAPTAITMEIFSRWVSNALVFDMYKIPPGVEEESIRLLIQGHPDVGLPGENKKVTFLAAPMILQRNLACSSAVEA